MNINGAFPSKYLRALDLGTARPVVTISHVVEEDIGGDHKPVIYFQGKERGMVLNKTNANAIVEIAGTPETDEWAGTRIRLYATRVDFQGKRVDAIRVEPAPANGKPAPKPAPKAKAEYDDSADAEMPEASDMPF